MWCHCGSNDALSGTKAVLLSTAVGDAVGCRGSLHGFTSPTQRSLCLPPNRVPTHTRTHTRAHAHPHARASSSAHEPSNRRSSRACHAPAALTLAAATVGPPPPSHASHAGAGVGRARDGEHHDRAVRPSAARLRQCAAAPQCLCSQCSCLWVLRRTHTIRRTGCALRACEARVCTTVRIYAG
jgi:hypothetical protein